MDSEPVPTITEADILERLIDPQEGELSPEVARHLLTLDLRQTDRDQMEQLATKARLGTLSAVEETNLRAYQRVIQVLQRMQAKARQVLAGAVATGQPSQPAIDTPPGIRSSQEAFWRALPALLEKNRGQWAAFHGDRQVGIARTKTELIREILHRGISRDQYFVGLIDSHELPPWDTEELEPIHPRHLDDIPSAP